MKSDILYNRLIGVDALLSFDGIIPSLPDLQLKLINLIDLFSKALVAEGENEQLSDALCYLLCRYLDGQIELCLRADKIAWDRYSLTNHFYGYQNETEKISDGLASLLANAKGQLLVCARKLLLLVAASAGNDRVVERLLAQYAPPPKAVRPPETEDEPLPAPPMPPAPHKSARLTLPIQLLLSGLLLVAVGYFCLSYLDTL